MITKKVSSSPTKKSVVVKKTVYEEYTDTAVTHRIDVDNRW
jgi:hypothetical protein